VKKDGSAVTFVVDYDGENDHGSSDVSTRVVVLSVRYNDTHVVGRVSGCDEVIILKDLGQPADTIVLGARASDPRYLSSRFFHGLIAEVLMYNRSLSDSELTIAEEHLANKYRPRDRPRMLPRRWVVSSICRKNGEIRFFSLLRLIQL
jgi:hypothetical protein